MLQHFLGDPRGERVTITGYTQSQTCQPIFLRCLEWAMKLGKYAWKKGTMLGK